MKTFFYCGGLPRHYHRVVFHVRKQYAVAFLEKPAHALNDQINARRCARSKNNFFSMPSVQEILDLISHFFIGPSCLFCKLVHASVNRSILSPIESIHSFKHGFVFLRCRRVVKISQFRIRAYKRKLSADRYYFHPVRSLSLFVHTFVLWIIFLLFLISIGAHRKIYHKFFCQRLLTGFILFPIAGEFLWLDHLE